jgi:predicted HAD superfamily Cof-like phosphohydrolase
MDKRERQHERILAHRGEKLPPDDVGFITQCCVCRRYRLHDRWLFDGAPGPEIKISHDLCPDCLKKQLDGLKDPRLDVLGDLREFHAKFFPDLRPPKMAFDVPAEVTAMRLNFMLEELQETADALGYRLEEAILCEGRYRHRFVERPLAMIRKADALDGLVDLLYVLAGTVDLLGLAGVFKRAWDRVHSANLTKARVAHAGESKRGSRYDVRKPVGWKKPELDDLVQ